MSIVVVSKDLTFEPSFDKFKKSLFNILEAICNAVRNFERLETQLYLDWAGPPEFLKPQISQPIIEQLKRQINQLIDYERIIPERKMAELRKYMHFYNDEELNRVEAFLRFEKKKLDEYEEKIKLYHDLARRIPIEIERTIFAGFFEVSHAPFVRTMVENIEHLKGLLVSYLVDRYQNTTKNVIAEYEAISERVLTPPPNTAALMKLVKFVQTTSDVTLKSLELRLLDVIEHITFLSDYWLLTESEISNNSVAFQWYHRMPQIFEDNRVIIENKMQEYQDALKVRYQKFEEELDSYTKQVEEMQYWGDIEEVSRYQRRAQTLETRLITAMDKIYKFNEEEIAFHWEITQYPLRKQIADRLQPFKKLFDSICEYLAKYDKWINSTIGSYNPEEIDNEVTQYYRIIYKLEKAFQEPDVRKLAAAVREKIEDFKDRMPTIMTLGNPGLKVRHWEQISAIAGIPIKVDVDLTLGKVLAMGLDPYIAQFEGISEAATKENTLEKSMDKMQLDWIDLIFTVNLYKDTGTYVIASVDDIQLLLDDHITKAVIIKNSPYIKPFEVRIIVQPHLKKCFEGIARLKFNEDLEVLAMRSTEGEEVEILEIISTSAARGQVEKWLIEIETEMRKSVLYMVHQAILAYHAKERTVWVLEWPGQTVLCVGQTYWTQQVEEAMLEGVTGLKRYLAQCQEELNNIILLIRGTLSKQNRITLEALVTLDVHSKDVLAELYNEQVVKNTDFRWLCQLRYYWLVRILNKCNK
ncbi:dynein heavy chain 7, axonemal-like [Pogonomyrmex barbatus]|uniref:Dynein heavy chain 7, axonemal-like n=1 Tax=Pogonomyrmex barbatus TaxID=144034 RepID=A0A8N1SAL5_9HYME|nr:dynein heavy chain 7, axonemal-like [Pogonomyrmex barbatus]